MTDEHPIDGTLPAGDEQALSDYLLGELDPNDRERIERLLADDSALRSRAQQLAPLVTQLEQLDDAWEFVASQHTADQTSADDRTRPQPAAAGHEHTPEAGDAARTPTPRQRWWQRPLAVRPALAAAAAAALLATGVGVGALLERTSAPNGATVTLHPLPGEPPTATAQARITPGGRMVLIIRHLPGSKPGTYYEAWLMTNITQLVPIASFRPSAHGNAQITVPLPAAAASYRYIDISLQHTGAGTTHSHQSVLRGKT